MSVNKFKSMLHTKLRRIIANATSITQQQKQNNEHHLIQSSSSTTHSLFVHYSDPAESGPVKEASGGTSQGLIVLAVVFSVFGLLVIVFMLYIVRRVRYRHLYMQVRMNTTFIRIESFEDIETTDIYIYYHIVP